MAGPQIHAPRHGGLIGPVAPDFRLAQLLLRAKRGPAVALQEGEMLRPQSNPFTHALQREGVIMDLMKRPNEWQRRFLGVALWLTLLLLLTPGISAAQLNIDETLANSPYNVAANITFANETIGTTSIGVLNQGGFINTVTNRLRLGDSAGSSGTYNLSGTGNLNTNFLDIGWQGTGTFIQTGGNNTVATLQQAIGGSITGTYIMSLGTLNTSSAHIGVNGNGVFTQTGGNHTAIWLELGSNPGGTGTYNLSGTGNLTATLEFIGLQGNATFNQANGTNTATFQFVTSFFPSASSTYNLSGGNLLVTGDEVVGNAGFGVFNQTGGLNAMTNQLALCNGIYNLSFGNLTVGTNEYIGYISYGTFNQTGGNNAVAGDFFLGRVAGGNGTYALLGGNLAVTGNYAQTAGSTLAVGIASPTSYAQIPVGGTASLNGTVAPVLQGGYIPQLNQFFPGVITAAGGVTGNFTTIANKYITPILYWQDLYTATTFDLLVRGNFNNPTLNLTHNQANVGHMFNGLADSATGDLANILNGIARLPNNRDVANAYQQISADKAAALSTLAFAGANLQKRTLSRRITDLRFGNRETGTLGGLPGSFNLNFSRESGLMLAYNSSNLAGLLSSKSTAAPAAPQSRWGLYLDPAIIFGDQRSSRDQTGFNFTIAGFNAGADYRVRDNLLVGLATGYSHTSTDFRGSGGSVDANTWPLTVYAAYLPETFYVYGSLGYALNLFNLGRRLEFTDLNRTAKSSTTGNQFNAYGEAGYDLKVKRLVVTPMLSLAYSKLWVDGFNEGGAGALNLNLSSQNAQSLQTGLGAKVAAPMKRGSATVVPQVYATYQHEYSNGSRTLNARLSQGGSPCVYQTDSFTGQPHRNFAVVGANVSILTQNNLKVQLDYNAEVGRGNYTAHYVSAGVRYEF
jgi:outer membrane autotransporter protein